MDFAIVEVAADVDLAEVDHRGVRHDRDDFADAAVLHRAVDDRAGSRGQRNAGLHLLLEALELRRDVVLSERQQRRAKEPVGVGDDDALGTSIGVVDRDGDTRQQAAGGVLDGAFDRAVDRLRLAQDGSGHQPQQRHGHHESVTPATRTFGHQRPLPGQPLVCSRLRRRQGPRLPFDSLTLAQGRPRRR